MLLKNACPAVQGSQAGARLVEKLNASRSSEDEASRRNNVNLASAAQAAYAPTPTHNAIETTDAAGVAEIIPPEVAEAQANANESVNAIADELVVDDQAGSEQQFVLGPGAYHVVPHNNLRRLTNDDDSMDATPPQVSETAGEEILVTATLVGDNDDEEQQRHSRQDDVLVCDAEEVDEAALKINRMVSMTKSRKFRRGFCLALIAIAIIVGAALIGTSVAKSKCQAPDKAKLGNGICDAGAAYNNEVCNFDEGDCDQYNALVEQGCAVSASDASRLGDGVCDGGIFVLEGCNLDGGDCEPIAWDRVGDPIVGESAGDQSGAVIAFSANGKVLAIAAAKNSGSSGLPNSGHVRVHSYTGANWIQLGEDIDGGEAEGDSFGTSIAMSSDGTQIIVGANRQVSNQTGFAIVYEYDAGIDKWVQIGNRIARTPGSGPDVFGSAVAMSADGSIVAVGSPLANGNGTMQGACHTYKYTPTSDTWEEIGIIDGGVDMAFSAGSLSMSSDGTRLAIGAPFDNAGGSQRGTTRIYDYQESGGGWIKLGDSIPGKDGDGSGWSVSLAADGSKLAVGSPSQDKVRVYSHNEAEEKWQNVGAEVVGKAKGNEFGGAVSLSADGTRLAVGARSSRIGRGQVRVFQYDEASQTWSQVAIDIDGAFLTDALGWSVSLSPDGKKVAIGSPSALAVRTASFQGTGRWRYLKSLLNYN